MNINAEERVPEYAPRSLNAMNIIDEVSQAMEKQ